MTTRFPAKNLSVTPMSQLDDYELVHDDQDVRGWEVRDQEGRLFGRVRDLLIDTKHDRVASLLLDDQSQLSVGEVSIGDNVVLLDEASSKRVDPPVLVTPESPAGGLADLGRMTPMDISASLAELDIATRVEEIASQAMEPRRPKSLRPSRTLPATDTTSANPLAEIALATGIEQLGSGALMSEESPGAVTQRAAVEAAPGDGQAHEAAPPSAGAADPFAEIALAMSVAQLGSRAIDTDASTDTPRPAAVSAPFIDSSRGGPPAMATEVNEGAPFAEIAMALGVERAASEALDRRVSALPEKASAQPPTVTSLTSAPMFFAVDSRREPSSFVLPEFDSIRTGNSAAPVTRATMTTIDDEDVIPLPDDAFVPVDYEPHYREHFASTGLPFAQYVPAYGLGHELRVGPTLATHTWEQLSPEAQRVWESRHPGTWEHFKEAVRHGWERLNR